MLLKMEAVLIKNIAKMETGLMKILLKKKLYG